MLLSLPVSICIAVAAAVVSFAAGVIYRKKIAEAKLGGAEQKAKDIVAEAEKQAETKKKEILLSAKEEVHKSRAELDREIKDRRAEINRLERRVEQKEANVDKKNDALDKKDEKLNQKMKELEALTQKTEEIKAQQIEILEKLSGLTREEAKEYLLQNLESEIRHESAIMAKDIIDQAKDDAEKRARDIIGSAIQKCAADHVAEATVSVVALPNDEMKGRIIGREGRNIRTLETLTGVDLIIDDTPEAVVLSAFDPIRREIARLALEKLIVDGRIHPTRIEETVEKARKEVESIIKQEGEQATFDTGVHGLHPEIIRLLGKLKYRTSYGQNVLKHSIEVR